MERQLDKQDRRWKINISVESLNTGRKNGFTPNLQSGNMMQTYLFHSKPVANMVNATFATIFAHQCKYASKCGIYHVCYRFALAKRTVRQSTPYCIIILAAVYIYVRPSL